MFRTRASILLTLLLFLSWSSSRGETQALHRIMNDENRFQLEEISTRKIRPFDMWVTRLANALMNEQFTNEVIANLDDYLRYGVNTLEICIQGGNLGVGKNGLYPRVYNANGTLKLECVVWNNLNRLLEACDRRGMVIIIQFWYHLRDENVPDDAMALEITRKVTDWLRATGRKNYLLDVVNEFNHNAFEVAGQKGVKRPLFATLEGALTMLEAVFDTDPQILAGMSPPGALLCPEGYLHDLPRGKRWVEARLILGHNQVADPMNPASYKLNSVPRNPRSKPYINTEFNMQLRYEKTPQNNPRTGKLSFGHWDTATIQSYISDMKMVRQLGGYANVFSHYQQYVARDATLPVASVGPEGTQPESTPGAGEPSMHWLFKEVSRVARLDPVPLTHDFNLNAPGLETDLAGTWERRKGVLCQMDANKDLAHARAAVEEGDLEISLEAGFTSPPGAASRLGIQVGAASPAGPAYRLLMAADRIELDQVGGGLPVTSVQCPKGLTNQYVLRISSGRIQVLVDGAPRINVIDSTPITGRNLLFITRKAAASFDNVRVSPIRHIDFDNSTTGDWEAVQAAAWKVVAGAGAPSNKVWEATTPANEDRSAALDRLVKDFSLDFTADLSEAASLGIRFRAGDVVAASGPDYTLRIEKAGKITLERRDASGPPVVMASSTAPLDPADISVRVTMVGSHIVVAVDGKTVLEKSDPTGTDLDPGGLVLVATSGKVRFDDLHLTVTPNRFPVVRIIPGNGPPLPAGFAIEYTDPEGLLDLTEFQLLLDLGNNMVVDVTLLMLPMLGIFTLDTSEDGKGVRCALTNAIDLTSISATLRAIAVDRWGNRGMAEYKINQGSASCP